MLVAAHRALGTTLFFLGEIVPARAHLEQGIALYDPQQHRASVFLYGDVTWRGLPQLCWPGRSGVLAILTRGCTRESRGVHAGAADGASL